MRSIGWVARTGPSRGTASIYVDGTRVASVNLYASSTRDRVVVWSRSWSGSAKHRVTIKVTSPSGEKTYTDAFYSCWGDGRTYVNGIDAVFGALRDASGN